MTIPLTAPDIGVVRTGGRFKPSPLGADYIFVIPRATSNLSCSPRAASFALRSASLLLIDWVIVRRGLDCRPNRKRRSAGGQENSLRSCRSRGSRSGSYALTIAFSSWERSSRAVPDVSKRYAAGLEIHCPGGALFQTGSLQSQSFRHVQCVCHRHMTAARVPLRHKRSGQSG
jgi:hypothetical protein